VSNSLPALLGPCLLTGALLGCGDDPPPPPQAAPEEFDDPFADEDTPVEGGEPADSALLAAADAPAPSEPEPEPIEALGATPDASADAEASDITPSPRTADDTADDAAADGDGRAAAKREPTSRSKDKADAGSTRPAQPAQEPAAAVATPPADPPATTPEPEPVAKPAPPVVQKPPPPAGAKLTGTYRYVGGAAQRQRLESAIDRTVQQLNALIRGIGRRRLTESNQIRDAVELKIQGDKVTTIFTPGGTVTTTLGASAISWTTDTGKSVKVKSALVKGRLVQDFQADDGSRRNVFTVDASGDKLTLSVTIRSDRMPEPLKYALSYRRK